jgi:dUTPase
MWSTTAQLLSWFDRPGVIDNNQHSTISNLMLNRSTAIFDLNVGGQIFAQSITPTAECRLLTVSKKCGNMVHTREMIL